MSKTIRTLQDFAELIGANDATERSCARRLFKDTECGICFSVSTAKRTRTTERTYDLKAKDAIGGPILVGYRYNKGPWLRIDGMLDLPTELREYVMDGVDENKRLHPDAAKQFEPFRNSASKLYTRHTVTLPRVITLKGMIVCLHFSGYTEGSDVEHPTHTVTLPASSDEIEKAIDAADADGVAAFDDMDEDE